jgi:hypothetical protein
LRGPGLWRRPRNERATRPPEGSGLESPLDNMIRSSQLAVGADDADAKNYIRAGLSMAALGIAAIIPALTRAGLAKVTACCLAAKGCLHFPQKPSPQSAFRNSLSCKKAHCCLAAYPTLARPHARGSAFCRGRRPQRRLASIGPVRLPSLRQRLTLARRSCR